MSDQIVELKVDGMTCNNCAASLNRFLERKGLEDVYVNFQTNEVRFTQGTSDISLEEVKKGIHKLGYSVVEEDGCSLPSVCRCMLLVFCTLGAAH